MIANTAYIRVNSCIVLSCARVCCCHRQVQEIPRPCACRSSYLDQRSLLRDLDQSSLLFAPSIYLSSSSSSSSALMIIPLIRWQHFSHCMVAKHPIAPDTHLAIAVKTLLLEVAFDITCTRCSLICTLV